MKKSLVVACLATCLLGMSSLSYGGYLYDWSTLPSSTISDAPGDATPGTSDITKAWYAYDNGAHYFRLDLAAAPDSAGVTYGLYIDSKAGGAGTGSYTKGTSIVYVPTGVSGIDFVLLASPTVTKSGQFGWDDKLGKWVLTDFKLNSSPTFQRTGNTLEWEVKDAGSVGPRDITLPFYWWAATVAGSTTPKDITSKGTATPIPSAAWLLVSGFIGLIGLKRKKQKTA